MTTILLIILLIVLLGGGGGYHAHGRYGAPGLGGVLGLVLSSPRLGCSLASRRIDKHRGAHSQLSKQFL
jgi:hypothetical protein